MRRKARCEFVSEERPPEAGMQGSSQANSGSPAGEEGKSTAERAERNSAWRAQSRPRDARWRHDLSGAETRSNHKRAPQDILGGKGAPPGNNWRSRNPGDSRRE